MKYLLIVLTYLVGIIIFGAIISKKKVKTAEDFVVAGRKLPMIILIGTLLATWCGGGGITGSASVVYAYGPWVGVLHFLGAPIGIFLLYFIAGKVRKSSKITVPEIFEARYGSTASVLAAICIILAYVGIVATQIKAAGNIINLLTGINTTLGIIIAAVIVLLLTVTGGMMTVAYSDAVSALLMVGGFLVAVPLLFNAAGGWNAAMVSLANQGKNTVTGGLSPIVLAGYMIPTIALLLGDQNMMQRFASAKDSNEAKKSNIGMLIAEIVVCTLIILMVTAGIVLMPNIEISSNIIFAVAVDYLPFFVGAIVLAACVSFIVTTADSFLLSASTNLTYDIWAKFIKKDATDKEKVKFLRTMIILLTILAVAFTLYFPTIITLQLTAYAMYGAAITPALLFALFSKRVTKAAGLIGIITGATVTVIWNVVLNVPNGIQAAIIAVPASTIAIFVVSMLTKNEDEQLSLEALLDE